MTSVHQNNLKTPKTKLIWSKEKNFKNSNFFKSAFEMQKQITLGFCSVKLFHGLLRLDIERMPIVALVKFAMIAPIN